MSYSVKLAEEFECLAGTMIEQGTDPEELKSLIDDVAAQVRSDQKETVERMRGSKVKPS